MMKKVYICSPLGGDVAGNLQRAKQYAKYALLCGTAPVVPHFYALCLNDENPKEREIGLAAGLSLLWFCDELWVFGDRVSHGMEKEINFAKNLNIRTCYIKKIRTWNFHLNHIEKCFLYPVLCRSCSHSIECFQRNASSGTCYYSNHVLIPYL